MKPGGYSQVLDNMQVKVNGKREISNSPKNLMLSPIIPRYDNDEVVMQDPARYYHLYLNELNKKTGTNKVVPASNSSVASRRALPSTPKAITPTRLPAYLPSLAVQPRPYHFKSVHSCKERKEVMDVVVLELI